MRIQPPHILLPLLLLLFTTTSGQQPVPLAVINDPDGFTYIRKGPSTSSPIVVTLHNDQPFAVHPGNGDWWRIDYVTWQMKWITGEPEGYIHRSRVRLLSDMPDTAQRGILCRTLAAVRKEYKRADKLAEEAGRIADPQKRKILSDSAYLTRSRAFEATYEMILEELAAHIIRTKDTAVLHEWLLVYIDTEGAAPEWPSDALAICFSGAPELVMSAIRRFPAKDRKILYGHIYFGLTNMETDNREDIEMLEKLLNEDDGMK